MNPIEQPLVSIGIPTYNRPEGLKHTLSCIAGQTYKNLQIIVADNCSENGEVKKVVDEFLKADPRIVYYRHDTNKGPSYNFKFVLEKAEGSYFMWAADDDEWHSSFVEKLMTIIGSYSAAFCNYSVKSTNAIQPVTIQNSASGKNKYEQARNFLQERIPSMMYGIFIKDDIRWFSEYDIFFDWFDCYFIFKIILLYDGVALSKENLYFANVGDGYTYKPMVPAKGRIFSYGPYVKASAKTIAASKISMFQKMKLMAYLIEVSFRSFLYTEKPRKNYKLYFYMYRLYRMIMPEMKIIKEI